MATLIKNVTLYSPSPLGIKDLLLVNDKIVAVGENLTAILPEMQTFDAKGLVCTPGFIDQHIHVTGGGGEGGPKTRAPELMLSELVATGTTSLVGVCGTDSVSRSVENLLAKIRALNAEGVSAWMHTSNYAFPPTTITGSVRKDLFAIAECIGVKIALGDHRSSFPTLEEILHLLTDVRVGGMIAGKTGFLHIHQGDLAAIWDTYFEIIERGFPIQHIRPTHCGRHKDVLAKAIEFMRRGGYIDITTGGGNYLENASDIIELMWDQGVDKTHLTFSTDGHGSMPRFNEKNEMVGLTVAGVEANREQTLRLIAKGAAVEDALSLVTRNPARALQLTGKGKIAVGMDADLNFFDENWDLKTVYAKGVLMMKDKEILKKGTFEE